MKKREPVSKLMTKNLHKINVQESLSEAEHLMKTKHIRHLPVMSGNELKGIISLTDLMRISFVDSYDEKEGTVDTAVYNMLTLEQVMTTKPVTVEANQTIREAAEILAEHQFHALPVMDKGRLAGILTSTDLIRYLLERY